MAASMASASTSSSSKSSSLTSPASVKAGPMRYGRGGRNIQQSVALDKAPVYALTLDHTLSIAGREVAGAFTSKKINSGRGGSGNIRGKAKELPKTAAIISQYEAPARDFERELIAASVAKRRATGAAGGRGGLGSNYLKVASKTSASSSASILSTASPDAVSLTPSSIADLSVGTSRPRARSLGRAVLGKLRLSKKAKQPDLPSRSSIRVATDEDQDTTASLPGAPSISRMFSNDDISINVGGSASVSPSYTMGVPQPGTSYYDDTASVAESTWSFHPRCRNNLPDLTTADASLRPYPFHTPAQPAISYTVSSYTPSVYSTTVGTDAYEVLHVRSQATSSYATSVYSSAASSSRTHSTRTSADSVGTFGVARGKSKILLASDMVGYTSELCLHATEEDYDGCSSAYRSSFDAGQDDKAHSALEVEAASIHTVGQSKRMELATSYQEPQLVSTASWDTGSHASSIGLSPTSTPVRDADQHVQTTPALIPPPRKSSLTPIPFPVPRPVLTPLFVPPPMSPPHRIVPASPAPTGPLPEPPSQTPHSLSLGAPRMQLRVIAN